ncbi:hypothetical protein [Psychrobacillus antarcticus]|uniref:hypothetical protein n=1 Tax=Psychrobacillus antarcticus TaxID=2879115 RepID=UPI002407AAAB|nr:hypothetical protein [Psychrobacillus antarcticus]
MLIFKLYLPVYPLTAAIGFVRLLQNDAISKENRTQYLSTMNGTIHVESDVGEGTTFKFAFPSLLPTFLEPVESEETEKELVVS